MLTHDLLDASHRAALQPDLDPVRMGRGFGENVLDNALGQFTRALILLQDDEHRHAGFDVRTRLTIHGQLDPSPMSKRKAMSD